jgi:hypothetical protein
MSIPKMHLLLKPQSSILSGRPGLILQKIFNYFAANQQPNIPFIPVQGFIFSKQINDYIRNEEKSVLMLVDAKTNNPCAALCFSYNDLDNSVYIDYFDGNKGVINCGGGATYLLDTFCTALDTITELGQYIKLTLHDVAKNSSVYNAYFSDRDAYKGRRHYSSKTGDNASTTRSRQKNGPYDDEDDWVLMKTVETNRGTGVAPNLRKYTIVSWIPPRVFLPRGAKFGKCGYSRHAPPIETRKSRSRSRDSSRSIDTINYPLSEFQIKKMVEKQSEQGAEHIISTILFQDENDNKLNASLNAILIEEAGCNYRDPVNFLINNFDKVKHNAILTKLKCKYRNELKNFLSSYNEEMADRPQAKGITKRKTKKMKMKMKMKMKKGYRTRR